MSTFKFRKTRESDIPKIFDLYKSVNATSAGLARTENEISTEYITTFTRKALKNGVQLVAEDGAHRIIAEIHCAKLEPLVFDHVLSELTIAVAPDCQGQGIGGALFCALLEEISANRREILRVELIAKESNKGAIQLYQKLGFRIEGRLVGRLKNKDGHFESDIPMAWLNPNFDKDAVVL